MDDGLDVSNVEQFAKSMGFDKRKYRVDLAHTRFIVSAWPDHRWPIQIMDWIEVLVKDVKLARPTDYRDSIVKENIVCARNTAIRDLALGSDQMFQWFIFLDRDVRPNDDTTPFLNLESDVKCCMVKQRVKTAYSWPTDFHETIWCTSRRVLEAIEPPWFLHQYSDDGCDMKACICNSFQRKVLEAGFSISHGGWAEHDRDRSWC